MGHGSRVIASHPGEERLAQTFEKLYAQSSATVPWSALPMDSSAAPHFGCTPRRRLRICYIAETVRTGVGRHLVDLIETMAERRHEVHLLHSFGRADPGLLQRVERLPGIRHQGLAMRREPHWSDIGIMYMLARYVRKWGPFDVIHGHSSKAGAYVRLLAMLNHGKSIYTPHAFITMSPRLSAFWKTTYGRIELGLSRLSDHIICTSSLERRHALELGLRPDKLSVVLNGLPPGESGVGKAARERLGLTADSVIIGFVGRLDEQKAPELVIEAAARIVAQKRNVHVLAIGDGPLRDKLAALTRRLGIGDAVSWLGDVPAREWLGTFDILAMPSRYEGFSYVLLEALNSGLPVVCTAVGGVAEAIGDGINGFIVPHEDVEALARRLSQLVDDRDLRTRMGTRARQHSARFSLKSMADEIEAIYLS